MNAPPAKVTITSTTGPGQAVTAQVFTDITDIDIDFGKNTIRLQRSGAGGVVYFDYSAMATLTWTITNGTAAIVISS